MQLAMHIDNAGLSDALKSYVERRMRFALGRFSGRVGPVTVRIEASGRTGHRCRITTEILPFGSIAVEEAGADLFAAIDRATGKLGRLFGRELERMRDARFGRESVRMAA